MSTENLEIVRALYDAFSRGDGEAALRLIDPAVAWDEGDGHPYGGGVTGRDNVVSLIWNRLGAEWRSLATIPERLIDGGENIVALGRDTAVNAATGRSLDVEFAHVLDIVDGRVKSFKQYSNTHGWHQAMPRTADLLDE